MVNKKKKTSGPKVHRIEQVKMEFKSENVSGVSDVKVDGTSKSIDDLKKLKESLKEEKLFTASTVDGALRKDLDTILNLDTILEDKFRFKSDQHLAETTPGSRAAPDICSTSEVEKEFSKLYGGTNVKLAELETEVALYTREYLGARRKLLSSKFKLAKAYQDEFAGQEPLDDGLSVAFTKTAQTTESVTTK